MKLAIHIAEQRYLFDLILANKNRIEVIQPCRGNIDVRKVIGTKDILFFPIESAAILNPERDEYKEQQQSCPPPVNDTGKFKLAGEKNRYQQKRQQDQKQNGKHDRAITGMYYAQYLHGRATTVFL
jgi:hypothetical protein